MTLSPELRLQNIHLAFQAIADELGDRPFHVPLFHPKSKSFADVLNSTWAELVASGHLVKATGSFEEGRTFQLTGIGWIEMLHRVGQYESVCEKLIPLRQAAKAFVKGRDGDQAVDLHDLAVAANVSDEWLINVIESRLLQQRFPDDEVDLAWWGHRGRFSMVRIPIRFGMQRLPC